MTVIRHRSPLSWPCLVASAGLLFCSALTGCASSYHAIVNFNSSDYRNKVYKPLRILSVPDGAMVSLKFDSSIQATAKRLFYPDVHVSKTTRGDWIAVGSTPLTYKCPVSGDGAKDQDGVHCEFHTNLQKLSIKVSKPGYKTYVIDNATPDGGPFLVNLQPDTESQQHAPKHSSTQP